MRQGVAAPQETVDLARRLWEAGEKPSHIARRCRVSAPTIFNWAKKWGWRRIYKSTVVGHKEEAQQLRRRGETIPAIAARLSIGAEAIQKWISEGCWDEEPRVESAAALEAYDREAGRMRLEIINLHRKGRSIYEIADATNLPWPRVHLVVFDERRRARKVADV